MPGTFPPASPTTAFAEPLILFTELGSGQACHSLSQGCGHIPSRQPTVGSAGTQGHLQGRFYGQG